MRLIVLENLNKTGKEATTIEDKVFSDNPAKRNWSTCYFYYSTTYKYFREFLEYFRIKNPQLEGTAWEVRGCSWTLHFNHCIISRAKHISTTWKHLPKLKSFCLQPAHNNQQPWWNSQQPLYTMNTPRRCFLLKEFIIVIRGEQKMSKTTKTSAV